MGLSILENYKIKLVVLVFAIFIWFFVITENEYENVIEIPVVTVNLPENKVILNEIPDFVKVKIKGTGKDLIALGVSRAARLDLDLSHVEHSKTFAIESKNVFLSRPTGAIEIEEIIMPDSITVILDDHHEKKIPIVAKIKPHAAPGFTLVGEIKLNPDSVTISGPKSIVSQIDEVFTEDTEFPDLRFDLSETVPLAQLPSNKAEHTIKQTEVFLNVQMLVEKPVTGVPVQVKNVPRNVSVYVVPSTLSLVLEGGGDLLAKVSRNDIIAYLDYNRIINSPGKEYPAVIEQPRGISYRDVKPKTFKLVFENSPTNN